MEEFNRTYHQVIQKRRHEERNTKIFKQAQEMLVAQSVERFDMKIDEKSGDQSEQEYKERLKRRESFITQYRVQQMHSASSNNGTEEGSQNRRKYEIEDFIEQAQSNPYYQRMIKEQPLEVDFNQQISRNKYLQKVQKTHEVQIDKIISEMNIDVKFKDEINQSLANKSPMRQAFKKFEEIQRIKKPSKSIDLVVT